MTAERGRAQRYCCLALALAAAQPQRLYTRFETPVHAIRSEADGVELDCGDAHLAERYDLAVVAEGGVFAEQARKSLTHDYHQNAWVGTLRLAGAGLQPLTLAGRQLLPIVQGGMGVGVSAHRLAGSVAAQGGVGTLSSIDLRRHHPDLMARSAGMADDDEAKKAVIAQANQEALAREIDLEVRVTVLGHLQRGGGKSRQQLHVCRVAIDLEQAPVACLVVRLEDGLQLTRRHADLAGLPEGDGLAFSPGALEARPAFDAAHGQRRPDQRLRARQALAHVLVSLVLPELAVVHDGLHHRQSPPQARADCGQGQTAICPSTTSTSALAGT